MRGSLLGCVTLVGWLALPGSVAAAPAAAQTAQTQEPPSIVTHGEATIRRSPDQAFLIVSVEARAKNPRDAQRQNAEAMAAVQQRVVAAGVPRDALRTVGFDLQQEFDFTNGRRVPREYLARNSVEIRVDVVERAGEVLDAAIQAGATSVAGVRFDLKDRAAAEREALRLAVIDARARADAAAAGAGRVVDRVLRVEDAREPSVVRPMIREMVVQGAAAAATPVEAGTIEVRATVTLTVAIR